MTESASKTETQERETHIEKENREACQKDKHTNKTDRQTDKKTSKTERERERHDRQASQTDRQTGTCRDKRTRHIVTGIVALLILQLVAQRRENAT